VPARGWRYPERNKLWIPRRRLFGEVYFWDFPPCHLPTALERRIYYTGMPCLALLHLLPSSPLLCSYCSFMSAALRGIFIVNDQLLPAEFFVQPLARYSSSWIRLCWIFSSYPLTQPRHPFLRRHQAPWVLAPRGIGWTRRYSSEWPPRYPHPARPVSGRKPC
jgi:hypothetical protein